VTSCNSLGRFSRRCYLATLFVHIVASSIHLPSLVLTGYLLRTSLHSLMFNRGIVGDRSRYEQTKRLRARSAAPFSKTAPAKISATVFKHAIFKNPTFCADVTRLSRRLWQIKLTLKNFKCFTLSASLTNAAVTFLYLIIVVHIDNMLSLLSPTSYYNLKRDLFFSSQ
jgi:hypothetical protein